MITKDPRSVSELASKLYDALETSTRTSGEKFVRLKDGSPAWMDEVVEAAHGHDLMPDDWRYEEIKGAAADINNNDGDYETVADEAEADVYNIDRLRWLASHIERPAICDEAAKEWGFEFNGDDRDTLALIGLGQMYERAGIIRRLGEALEQVEQ